MFVYRFLVSIKFKIINIIIDVCRRWNNGFGNGWILKKKIEILFYYYKLFM